MRRLLAMFLVLCSVCLPCGLALAQGEDNADLFADGESVIISMDWSGEYGYVLLSDQCVYKCNDSGEVEQLCRLEQAEALQIVADENGAHVYDINSGKFGDIDESGVHWSEQELDFYRLFPEDDGTPYTIVRSFLREDSLYILARVGVFSQEGCLLFSFDLDGEHSMEYDLEDLHGMCMGPDGKFLCLRCVEGTYCLSLFDPDTEDMEDMDLQRNFALQESSMGGLAYSEQEDAVYVCANDIVYRSVAGGEFAQFAPVDTANIMDDMPAWALPGEQYALWNRYLQLRKETEIVRSELVFAGYPLAYYMGSAAMRLFENQYPDVQMNITDQMSSDEIAQAFLTLDDTVDIYIVQADYSYSALKEKNFVLPLTQSKIIADAVAQMDENIRSVLCDANGDIVAYPYSLDLYTYGINEGYWHMFWPDRPLPDTYDELLDAWIDWEENIAQDYQGVGFVDWNFDYEMLIMELMQTYVMQHDEDGMPEIDTPQLRSALEKAKKIYEIRLEKGRTTSADVMDPQLDLAGNVRDTGPGKIYKRIYSSAMVYSTGSGKKQDDIVYGVHKATITDHTITFDDAYTPRTSGSMQLYIVNPNARNKENAIHFLEIMTQREADYYLYYALRPNATEPYENPSYQKQLAQYEEKKQQLERNIEHAAEEGKEAYVPSWEYELEECNDWLEDESNRWIVSPQAIDSYWEMLSSAPLNLHTNSPYITYPGTAAYQVIDEACAKYASGNLTLDAFLQEVSSRMQMIYWENQ